MQNLFYFNDHYEMFTLTLKVDIFSHLALSNSAKRIYFILSIFCVLLLFILSSNIDLEWTINLKNLWAFGLDQLARHKVYFLI